MKRILISVVMIVVVCAGLRAQDTSSYPFLGKYKFPEGSVVPGVEVTIDNGSLVMSSTAGVSKLNVLGKDSFNIVSFNGFAVFRRNETKKVVAVHIEASGYTLDGVKDSAAVSGAAIAQARRLSPGICFPEKIYSSREQAEKEDNRAEPRERKRK